MQISGPSNITLHQNVTLEPPSAGQRFRAVVIANSSPFLCSVRLSSSGDAQWLQAWSADAYAIAEGDIPSVTAEQTTDTSGLVTSGTLTASWYLATDNLTGTYPAPLSSAAVAAAVSGTVDATVTNAISATITNTITANIANAITAAITGSAFAYEPPIQSDSSGVANVTAGGAALQIVPAPRANYLQRIRNWSLATNLTAEGQLTVSGATTGTPYLTTDVPVLANSVPPNIGLIDLVVNEALKVAVTGGGTGNVEMILTYVTIPTSL